MRQSRHLGMSAPLKQWFHPMTRQTYGADGSGTVLPIHINSDNTIRVYGSTMEMDPNWGTIVIGFHGGAAIPIDLNEVSPKLKYGNSIKFSLYTMWAGNYGGTDDCTNSFFCAVVKRLDQPLSGNNIIFGKQPLHTIVTVTNNNVSAHMFKEINPGSAAGGSDNVYIGASPKTSQLTNSEIERLKKIRNFFHPKRDKKFFTLKDGINGKIYLLVWGEPYGRENYHLRPTKYKRTTRTMNADGQYEYKTYPGYVTVKEPTGARVSVGYLASKPFDKEHDYEEKIQTSTSSSPSTPTPQSTTHTQTKTVPINQVRSHGLKNNIWTTTNASNYKVGVIYEGNNKGYGSVGLPIKFDNNNNILQMQSNSITISFNNISNLIKNTDYITFYIAISTHDILENDISKNNYINGILYNMVPVSDDTNVDENIDIDENDMSVVTSELDEGIVFCTTIQIDNSFTITKQIVVNTNDLELNKQYYLYIFPTAINTNIEGNFTFSGNINITLSYEGYN